VPAQIKFYLNEHIQAAVTSGLRRRGVDVLTTLEAGRTGSTDEEQLAFASQQGRVMVTMDSDYIVLGAQGIEHAGIVYAPAVRSVGDIIRGLLLIHDVLQPEDLVKHVEFL
jgi:hypothetical protein